MSIDCREREFYKDKGIPCPKDVEVEEKALEAEAANTEDGQDEAQPTDADYHRFVLAL